MNAYLPLLAYLTVALIVPIGVSFVASAVQAKKPEPQKYLAYESGHPTQALLGRFPVKFYLVAMLFVIFDVEAAAFYPWAVNLKALGFFGLYEMISFMLVLAVGYAYVWKKGGFQWR